MGDSFNTSQADHSVTVKGLEGLHLRSSPQPDYSIVQIVIIKPSAFHSLTTTTHPSNINHPSSGQQVTAGLSAHKVSVTGGGAGPKTPWSGTLQHIQ